MFNRLMRHRCLRSTSPLILLIVWCLVGHARVYQAPVGPDGSWNAYEAVPTLGSWVEATELAESRTLARGGVTVGGELVSINSATENAVVEYLSYLLGSSDSWIGLTDREGAAPWNEDAAAPQESSTQPDPARDGWAWVSGEPVSWVHWAPGAPHGHPGLDAARMTLDGRWRDDGTGFPLDSPIVPTRQPNTSPHEPRFTSATLVVEYPFHSPSPLADIPVLDVPDRLPAYLPGLPGQNGMLGVTDYQVESVPLSVRGVAAILNEIAAKTRIPIQQAEGQYAKADLAPSGNSGGPLEEPPLSHPLATQPPHLFPDTISVAKGTVFVPEERLYTIRVNSGQSFALRLGDAEFQEVRGSGGIDSVDRRVLYYSSKPAPLDTYATVRLPAGYHQLSFIAGSRLRHFWEIASAEGNHLGGAAVNWLPIGSHESRPAEPVVAPVRLNGAATVANLPEDRGGKVEDLRAARDQLFSADPQDLLVRNDVTTLVLRDTSGVCCNRPGGNLDPAYQFVWPVDQDRRATDAPKDRDFFASLITGSLAVDDGDDQTAELLDVTFALFTEFNDSAADLWIEGASFQQGNRLADLNEEINRDTILQLAPGQTATGAILGQIQLREGEAYAFESAHFDHQNDAGWELFAALGDHTESGFDANAFFPVSSTFTITEIPANRGLQLISLPGDFDHDADLDRDDLNLLTGRNDLSPERFDLNSDGIVDHDDTLKWIRELKQTWIGDVNLDGQFGSADLVAVLSAGRYEQEVPANWFEGDWTGDGRFDSSDLVAAMIDGGYEAGGRSAVYAVPEPFSTGRLVLLAAALVAPRWRRRRCILNRW